MLERLYYRGMRFVVKVALVLVLVPIGALIMSCAGRFTSGGTAPAGGSFSIAGTAREVLIEKDLGLQEQATTILTTVQDQQSLNTAKPKLTALVTQHAINKAELQKLGAVTLSESKALANKYGDRSKSAKQNMAREMTRVNSTIPGGGEVYVQLLDLWQGL
jgi:hypothetical protein